MLTLCDFEIQVGVMERDEMELSIDALIVENGRVTPEYCRERLMIGWMNENIMEMT